MHPSKDYRGSHRRLKRLRPGRHWSVEMWFLLGWLGFVVLVVVPWMIRQSQTTPLFPR
jgi:hypothetical protein